MVKILISGRLTFTLFLFLFLSVRFQVSGVSVQPSRRPEKRPVKSKKKLPKLIVLLLIVGAVCSPELAEGSTAIYSVWHIPINEVSYKV